MSESRGITEENYPQFKKAYLKAVKEKKEIFIFEEQEVLTSYAKYACEYMDMQLKEAENARVYH